MMAGSTSASASAKAWKGRCCSYSVARPRSTVKPAWRALAQTSLSNAALADAGFAGDVEDRRCPGPVQTREQGVKPCEFR